MCIPDHIFAFRADCLREKLRPILQAARTNAVSTKIVSLNRLAYYGRRIIYGGSAKSEAIQIIIIGDGKICMKTQSSSSSSWVSSTSMTTIYFQFIFLLLTNVLGFTSHCLFEDENKVAEQIPQTKTHKQTHRKRKIKIKNVKEKKWIC